MSEMKIPRPAACRCLRRGHANSWMTRFPCDSASPIQGRGPDVVVTRDISWARRDICWATMTFDGADCRISAVGGSTYGEESQESSRVVFARIADRQGDPERG